MQQHLLGGGGLPEGAAGMAGMFPGQQQLQMAQLQHFQQQQQLQQQTAAGQAMMMNGQQQQMPGQTIMNGQQALLERQTGSAVKETSLSG
jgi:hypothetical protein